MFSLFSRKSVRSTALCLALGAQCLGRSGAFQRVAWAQEPVAGAQENQALQTATEAQVKELWSQLQADSVELEATDPRGAITRYQKFFEQGAGRFPSVGVQVALRIAHLWQIDIGNYDKAVEIYDWALGLYKNQPQEVLLQLQQGRLAAEQTQEKAEAAHKTKGTVPPGAPGSAPLTVGVPRSATPGKLEVGAPTPNPNSPQLAASAVPYLAPRGNALGWQPGADRCVTALAQQQHGAVWVATEDAGVWVYTSSVARVQDRWHQFTAKDGLGDDSAYALAVDKQNRVWAGTLNHGVSVWNGQAWKNYGVLDGPLGERVFAIKVCPTSGDVWIATNAGLTRYSVKNDRWSYITRAEGLPSDQVQAIAFDGSGNIVVGTQCDGVALAQAADDYKTWRVVKGPEQMPVTPVGKGLPSSLINDVLVAKDGTIYAATTTGLAWSRDGGANWSYVRGQDYTAKIKGSYAGPPPSWSEAPGAVLAEDYVSCLAQDEGGRIWLGHWQAGGEMVQMQSGPAGVILKEALHRQDSGLVRAILPRSDGTLLLARYDEGLSYSSSGAGQGGAATKPAVKGAVAASILSFPTATKAPSLDQLNVLLASLGQIEPLDPKTPFVTELAEDWTTQGDWLGRYGRYWASLNAMVSPANYLWGGGWTPIDHAFGISPKQQGDALRYYVARLQTDNPRSLEMPPTYLDSRLQKGLTTKDQPRRQAELDDHGEDYPLTKEGPNIYFSVDVPPGLWTLSFYNTNKDGHEDLNRMRDYRYSIRPHNLETYIDDVSDFDAQPELAHSRQHDFFGGVYKRFLVRGPQQLTVEMNKNNSRNTILAGAFLDLLDEQPPPYFGTVTQWKKRERARKQESDELSTQSAKEHAARFAPATSEKEAADHLFLEAERLREINPPMWAQKSRPIYAALARWIGSALNQANTEETIILRFRQSTCYYNLARYNEWEDVQRRAGLIPARDIEKSLRWDGRSSDGEGFQVIQAQMIHATSKKTQ